MSLKLRVLVTGSSGAIGKSVTAALLHAGHEVVALSRSMPMGDDRGVSGLKHVVGNIRDHEYLRLLIAETDAVCHLAAFIPPRFDSAAHASSCFEINSLATLHLASIACDLGKKLIYGSSGSIYVPSAAPSVETAVVYPAAHAPYYLGSKLLGEIYIEHFRLSHGLDSIIFRIGSAYGPDTMKSVVTKFISNAKAGRPLTVLHGGSATADFVYVGDLARLFVAAVEGKQSGIFNAGSGTATSILALAQAVCEIYDEYNPVIEQVRTDDRPPPSFSALSMNRTNKAFSHAPTLMRDGLRLIKAKHSSDAHTSQE